MNKSRNYPVGSKIICRSNEDEPLMIGTIIAWDGPSENIPVVKDELTNKEFFVMGVIRHYDLNLLKTLNKLTPDEQWNVLAEFGYKKVIETDLTNEETRV
jgi:hypothetical protein